MRQYIDIIEDYNKACAAASEEAIGTIIAIVKLGDGFKNNGALLSRAGGGGKDVYVLAPNPTQDDVASASEEAAKAESDDDKITILVQHGILLRLRST